MGAEVIGIASTGYLFLNLCLYEISKSKLSHKPVESIRSMKDFSHSSRLKKITYGLFMGIYWAVEDEKNYRDRLEKDFERIFLKKYGIVNSS